IFRWLNGLEPQKKRAREWEECAPDNNGKKSDREGDNSRGGNQRGNQGSNSTGNPPGTHNSIRCQISRA
ncbi:hypothetical protein FRC09_012907, partial [Ceratobasidium sp. 395]